MLDEITGFWPEGGPAGLGRLRARQRVVPPAWYFKAHFFQDPVQPGSLGLEALVELAHALIKLQGWADGIADPEFEPLAKQVPLVWRYRGQVVPTNKAVVTEIEALSLEHEADGGVLLTARGHLWVDNLRIYETPTLSVRVKPRGH
jgi:3-hydroxymyristoyl/3-hydroxydecanoyl-(acyl carrier protein) dehydratase